MTESKNNIETNVIKRDHNSFLERMVIRMTPIWIVLSVEIFMWRELNDKTPLLIINALLIILYVLPLIIKEKYYLNKVEVYNENVIFSGTIFFKSRVISVDKNRLEIKKKFSIQRGRESYKLLIYQNNKLIFKVYSLTRSEGRFRKEVYETIRKYLVNKGIPVVNAQINISTVANNGL
ncbi:hypothetical protein [Carboxylicivirga sp. M1479]|uniref:hypothetical protein n=1 Tax=Carboxylicivirga sp. M1479 TaxID=2594476 RepID=UPI0011781E7C|nr:hypothetical protein [Carboxylicivirga sp. M1479]TRX65858.1 hypothetical protein FNN09_16330 [Carboxylicivirga sp. M1479]